MGTRYLLVFAVSLLPSAAQAQAPATRAVPLNEFRELSWLIGRWHGSNRWTPSFYEQYRFRDDSTIAMTAYTDSTFQTETADSSLIQWRNGVVQTWTPRATYEVIELAPGRVRFRRSGRTDGGHLFAKVSPNEWSATIFPRGASTDTTVFRMQRVLHQ